MEIKLKRAPHDFGLRRFDRELLFGLAAIMLGDNGAIAERRRRAVPEAAPRVLQHRAAHMLGGLQARIFLKRRQHGAHQGAA